LNLTEGETVGVTVAKPKAGAPGISDEECARRVAAAKTFQEWVEITKQLPPDDGGYDILKALDENRRLSGELPRFAESKER
jgi:hypothetical protein